MICENATKLVKEADTILIQPYNVNNVINNIRIL